MLLLFGTGVLTPPLSHDAAARVANADALGEAVVRHGRLQRPAPQVGLPEGQGECTHLAVETPVPDALP